MELKQCVYKDNDLNRLAKVKISGGLCYIYVGNFWELLKPFLFDVL
jgi:hypothetical protein